MKDDDFSILCGDIATDILFSDLDIKRKYCFTILKIRHTQEISVSKDSRVYYVFLVEDPNTHNKFNLHFPKQTFLKSWSHCSKADKLEHNKEYDIKFSFERNTIKKTTIHSAEIVDEYDFT